MDELEEQVRSVVPEVDLQTNEPKMREALDVAFKTAASEATILLRGESGTGKGVLARAIHARSQRAANPFVTLHCPSLSAELLESELFGHVQGGFHRGSAGYGRKGGRRGRRHAVARRNRRLAADCCSRSSYVCSRNVATSGWENRRRGLAMFVFSRPPTATWRPRLAAGHFREDLYYRLNVIEVTVPPLRDRPGDILPLAEHLLRFFARQNGKTISGFAEPVREAILRYPWPGNIRELRNAVERGVILAASPIVKLTDLPSQIANPNQAGSDVAAEPGTDREVGPAGEPLTLDQIEAEHIRRILASTATIEEAATKMGIDPSTLYRKRKKYGI